VAALFLLPALFLIMTSCGTVSGGIGGGSGPGGGGGSTPSGTYPIQVNVTSNGVQHGITVTLTVD
jgi:hypothetical protein